MSSITRITITSGHADIHLLLFKGYSRTSIHFHGYRNSTHTYIYHNSILSLGAQVKHRTFFFDFRCIDCSQSLALKLWTWEPLRWPAPKVAEQQTWAKCLFFVQWWQVASAKWHVAAKYPNGNTLSHVSHMFFQNESTCSTFRHSITTGWAAV